MSSITWGVCTKERTVTVFCNVCRTVFNLHEPMVEALELKMTAESSHVCPGAPTPVPTDMFGYPLEPAHG